jgi:hypothetical protein
MNGQGFMMNSTIGAALLALLSILLFQTGPADPPARSSEPSSAAGAQVIDRAVGTFEVTIRPLDPYDDAEGSILGRMSIDKRFEGDLVGASRGEMLTAMTPVSGSAGYVALERVEGTLHGRRGSFVLQHSGTMTRGAQELALTVVPDSGTDELEGLAGSMSIDISNGVHAYAMEYTLPE